MMNYSEFDIIDGLYHRINSRSDKYKISEQRFKMLFGISPTFYLYEYCPLIERHIYDTHHGAELKRYLNVLDFIKCLITLVFSSPRSSSRENEYASLYSFLNIINVNRSPISHKRILRDKLFQAFLFSAPISEEVVAKFSLSTNGIYYSKKNINQMFYEIIGLPNIDKRHERDVAAINHLLTITYHYLMGQSLSIPYYTRLDIYAYYFFNPLDFVNLYATERSAFYELLNNCATGSNSFMKKSFIYNCNLFVIKSIDDLYGIRDNVENHNKIIPILLNSDSILPNNILRDVKLGHLTY